MAERKTYKEIVRKFLENDEVVVETCLDGERAGEKMDGIGRLCLQNQKRCF